MRGGRLMTERNSRRRTILRRECAICSLLLGGAIYGTVSTLGNEGYGRYDLTIHIECANDPPVYVSCVSTSSEEVRAEWEKDAANGIYHLQEYSPTSNPYDGQPLKIRIYYDHDTSMLGRTMYWSQSEKYLGVYAEWAGGRTSYKIMDIPCGLITREVRVQLP